MSKEIIEQWQKEQLMLAEKTDCEYFSSAEFKDEETKWKEYLKSPEAEKLFQEQYLAYQQDLNKGTKDIYPKQLCYVSSTTKPLPVSNDSYELYLKFLHEKKLINIYTYNYVDVLKELKKHQQQFVKRVIKYDPHLADFNEIIKVLEFDRKLCNEVRRVMLNAEFSIRSTFYQYVEFETKRQKCKFLDERFFGKNNHEKYIEKCKSYDQLFDSLNESFGELRGLISNCSAKKMGFYLGDYYPGVEWFEFKDILRQIHLWRNITSHPNISFIYHVHDYKDDKDSGNEEKLKTQISFKPKSDYETVYLREIENKYHKKISCFSSIEMVSYAIGEDVVGFDKKRLNKLLSMLSELRIDIESAYGVPDRVIAEAIR